VREKLKKLNMVKNTDNFLRTLIFFSLVLILFPSAAADCFTYQDSPFYCTEMSKQDAVNECSLYPGCVNSIFSTPQSCAELPECQKVLCKSTCRETFLGNCASGEVPSGEEEQWCSAGCCSFQYGNQNYCQYTTDKWRCAVAAQNKFVVNYNFDTNLNQQSCSNFCSQNSFGSTVVSQQPANPAQTLEKISKPQQNVPIPSEQQDYAVLWIIILILLLAALFYFYHYFHRSLRQTNLPSVEKNTTPLPSWLSPFNSNPQFQQKLNKMRKKNRQKLKSDTRAEYLALHDLALPSVDDFSKLQHLAKMHEDKGKHRELVHSLRRLQKMTKHTKKPSKDFADVFADLNKIVKKK